MSETQGGSNVAIVALIVIAVLVAGAAFLFFGGGGGGGGGSHSNTVIERSVEKVTPGGDSDAAPKSDSGPGLSLSHESDDGQKTSIEANP